jgi:DNA-binding beta-propeller fold protein YncE
MNRATTILAARCLGGAATVLLAIGAAFLPGCATAPPPKPQEKLVWPAPPLPPRIKFVRSITSADDLKTDTTFTTKMAVFLGGERIPEGRIAQPMGLAISDDGQRLYVSDPLQQTVFTFDLGTLELRQNNQVQYPGGLALDAQENLYVVDTGSKLVSVFDRQGNKLRDINDGSLVRPNGVAVDRRSNRVYVVDTGNSESKEQNVKIYDTTGRRIGAIGGAPGGGFSEFKLPTMVAVDDSGKVYVTDTLNARVQIFDADGKFLFTFGQTGSSWGEFDKPKGIALDTFGNIYVVDTGWSNVQIFNQKGEILLFFGGRGPIPGMMKNPISMAIDRQNRIYVGDYLNHRVNVYELVNTKPEDSYITPTAPNPTATPEK